MENAFKTWIGNHGTFSHHFFFDLSCPTIRKGTKTNECLGFVIMISQNDRAVTAEFYIDKKLELYLWPKEKVNPSCITKIPCNNCRQENYILKKKTLKNINRKRKEMKI